MKRILLRPLLLLLLIIPCLAAGASEPVRIGVLAKRGAEQALAQWQETANYLNEKIPGHHFEIIPLDFMAITPAVAAGKIDFVLANSGFYVDFEMRFGASRIATLRNRDGGAGYTLFGGVLFTRSDRDDIDSIGSIAGKRLGAVEADSLGGFLTAWRELAAAGVNPYEDTELSFAGTHDAVVYQVLDGKVDVGTVRSDTLERMATEGKLDLEQIKVINPQHYPDFHYHVSTRLYPEWPFAKVRHTPDVLSHAVATALLEMPADSLAAQRGNIVGWAVPRNYQPVHELMRELKVGPYADLGKISLEDLLRNYWHWLLLTVLLILMLLAVILYIAALNRRLRLTEGSLVDARDHLAERVRERTAELEASRAQLTRISRDWNEAFDAIDDPIFIHDAEMRIIQANPAYCQRAGVPLQALLGEHYFDHFPRLEQPLPACLIFPEMLQGVGDELTLENGDIYISRSFGIRRADGTTVHAIHILEDVTNERRAEEAHRTLSRAIAQAGEGVVLLDREQRVSYCNPAFTALLGREICSTRMTRLDELVTPAHAAQLQELFKTRGESRSAEVELKGAAGEALPVYLTVGGVSNERQEHEGFVATVIDLSQLKQAEAQLSHRIALESLIAALASRFVAVEPGGIEAALEEAIRRLGEFSSADRVYLFHYDAEHDTISNSHEWCAPKIASAMAQLQQLPFSSFPWLREQLQHGDSVAVDDVTQLPPEAVAERDEFVREEITSLLNVPLSYGGRFVGFIGFDYVARQHGWDEADVRLLRTAGELIANTLGRINAVERVHQREASLAAAQQIAHLGNWDWNIITGELDWSDEIYRIFGLTPQQFGATYAAFLETIHADDREFVINSVNRAVAGECDYEIDHRIVLPDGSLRTVHEKGDIFRDDNGRALRMIGTVQDVTESRRSSHELQRLNRALRTLSRCNTTLVHAEEEGALLEAICRALIETGGYPFAWVGLAIDDERKTIRPVAHAGQGTELFEQFENSWAEGKAGEVPAGIAIRQRKYFIEHDIGASRAYAPWREAALAQGYASVIALPLTSQGELYGALTIDALEPDAFDENELALLLELAGDLAFGIHTLRSRNERQRAELALQQSQQQYEELYENAPNAYLSVSAEDGRLLQFNHALCTLLDYPRETLAQMKVLDLYTKGEKGLDHAQQVFSRFRQGATIRDEELQMCRRSGEPVWVSVSIDPVFADDGRIIESRSMVIDISERKQAEVAQEQAHARLQRSLVQTIQAIALTIEKRDPYTAGHQERVATLAVSIATGMGLEPERIEGLRLGALIHDIGKVSVPAEILNRPGKLEKEMFALIKIHPATGYEIIREIDFPWPLAQMVLQHHERLDGSGYPAGLKDGEILLESRILAVADVVEAMASHRPYRAALGLDAAMQVLEEGKGTIFDAAVVESCLRVLREHGMEWGLR